MRVGFDLPNPNPTGCGARMRGWHASGRAGGASATACSGEGPSGPNPVLFGVGIGAKRIPGADGDDAERRRWDMPPALAAAF